MIINFYSKFLSLRLWLKEIHLAIPILFYRMGFECCFWFKIGKVNLINLWLGNRNSKHLISKLIIILR